MMKATVRILVHVDSKFAYSTPKIIPCKATLPLSCFMKCWVTRMASRRKKNNTRGLQLTSALHNGTGALTRICVQSIAPIMFGSPAKALALLYPSIFYTRLIRRLGRGGAEAYPSGLRAKGYTLDRSPVHHRAPCYIQSQLNLQLVHNLSQTE